MTKRPPVRLRSPRGRWLAAVLLALALVGARPPGVDSLTSLAEATARVASCDAGCRGVVYFWSPRMPLSRAGIAGVEQAAERTGATLSVVPFEALDGFATASGSLDSGAPDVAEAILAAGALAHAPSLVVYAQGRVLGPAILGYKTADAYASMIERRLAGDGAGPPPAPPALPESAEPARPAAVTDYPAVGVPGAYFKSVAGRGALAYETDGRIYLLDLDDGQSRPAPGFVDFVPSPDGRYFVTPLPRNGGLGFYDAAEVFEAAANGTAAAVQPFAVDDRMRDQYPSVGILSSSETSVRYRVLTSWFEGLRYRDYEIIHSGGNGRPTVRPLGDPVVPCSGMQLSTPIMSQDGQEVAARDERSGTTKIYRMLPGGNCDEVVGLGMPTRKVAWHPSGDLLAFSTPRVRSATSGGAAPGIFVYDRRVRTVTRVPDSDGASQLAFPDFMGDDAIVFMVPGRTTADPSYFRVVEPLP